MSYEGFNEYVCLNGHYFTADPYYQSTVCPCGAINHWFHTVDQTNGMDEQCPNTFCAPKTEIGWDDIPCQDHYGNKYFLKNSRYQPEGPEWTKLPTTPEEIAAEQAKIDAQEAEYQFWLLPPNKLRIFSGRELLWAGDSEEEWNALYDKYLAEGKPDLRANGLGFKFQDDDASEQE